MKEYKQKIVFVGLVLMAVALPVAIILVQSKMDNRNLAVDTVSCVEQCPGKDGVLRSCTPPEPDGGSTDSLCYVAGRVEPCGGKSWCCPAPGGVWTLDMTKCPNITPTGTQNNLLNYKIAYGGVNPNSAQCVVDWPLQFMVLGGGESKTYVNVIPTAKTVVGEKLVFSGKLDLTGFTKTSGIAIFIKGPKHLQVKYGKNDQTGLYNQAGGELNLTEDTTYDFSGYPILPGDVSGVSSGVQDGVINGIDFAYIKAKSIEHETIDNGGNLSGDLDGNCQVNSNDVNLLKISLEERQGQLY